MLRQRSFGSLASFLQTQEEKREEDPEEVRPRYFIPGINGRARCLAGSKEGDTRTIYSCPTILQSKATSLRLVIKKNTKTKSLSSALSLHGDQTRTTIDTDTCTLSTKESARRSNRDPQKLMEALYALSQAKKARIKQVETDNEFYLNRYKSKRQRWKRIARLDEQVDLTPRPVVDERHMRAFNDETCDSVVSPLTNELSSLASQKAMNRKTRQALDSDDCNSVVSALSSDGVEETKQRKGKKVRKKKTKRSSAKASSDARSSSKSDLEMIPEEPTTKIYEQTPVADSPKSVVVMYKPTWITEQPRTNTDYSADEADSVVSLCSMDGGKTNLRFRRTQRLAAASSDDIRSLLLMELAAKSA
jgi:hypothetical protein